MPNIQRMTPERMYYTLSNILHENLDTIYKDLDLLNVYGCKYEDDLKKFIDKIKEIPKKIKELTPCMKFKLRVNLFREIEQNPSEGTDVLINMLKGFVSNSDRTYIETRIIQLIQAKIAADNSENNTYELTESEKQTMLPLPSETTEERLKIFMDMDIENIIDKLNKIQITCKRQKVGGAKNNRNKNGAAEAACCREGKPIRPLVIIKKIIVIIGKNKNKNKNKDKNKK